LEQNIAIDQSFKLNIDAEQIVREWWEVIILQKLYASPLGSNLVFRGGTALRLAYNSPRFSQDLDFSSLKPIDFKLFEELIRDIESRYPELTIKDLAPKYYTYLAVFKIKESWRQRPFSLKIELSKRISDYRKGKDYNDAMLKSPVINIEIVGTVATLNRIIEEKKEALKTRRLPRDVFDLWYLGQKLNIDLDYGKGTIPQQELRQDLRKFLPKNFYTIIDQL